MSDKTVFSWASRGAPVKGEKNGRGHYPLGALLAWRRAQTDGATWQPTERPRVRHSGDVLRGLLWGLYGHRAGWLEHNKAAFIEACGGDETKAARLLYRALMVVEPFIAEPSDVETVVEQVWDVG